MDWDNDTDDKSGWNEQKVFAQHYFDCAKLCRQKQFEGDLMGWKNALDTKTIHGIPILKEQERTDWYKKLEKLDEHFKVYFDEKIKVGKDNKGMYPTNKHYIDFKKELQKYEIDFDAKINEVMPFLYVKKKIDISGL